MHILKFHGYSDDTFGEYGETGQDVDNCGTRVVQERSKGGGVKGEPRWRN